MLQVDLNAICDNYRLLRQQAGSAHCAAVLKADAYGVGAAQVGAAPAGAGWRHFFVAHLDEAIALLYLMSHLACADEPDNPMNGRQLQRFRQLHARVGAPPASLANSSGIFLGDAFRFDLVRPGRCCTALRRRGAVRIRSGRS